MTPAWNWKRSKKQETSEVILLPRLGAHLSLWGHGHTCDSPGPHDGPCVCACGITQPYGAS